MLKKLKEKFLKLKEIFAKSKEEKMFYVLLGLPLAFMPLIMSLAKGTFIVNGKLQWIVIIDYYIELLSAVGATFLGVVAISQTQTIQNMETQSTTRNNSCNVYIQNNYVKTNHKLSNEDEQSYTKSEDYIALKFTNHSDPFLKQVDIWFDTAHFQSFLTLVKDEQKAYDITLPDKKYYENKKCRIIFTSCYDVRTYGEFEISTNDNGKLKSIKYYHYYGTEQPK